MAIPHPIADASLTSDLRRSLMEAPAPAASARPEPAAPTVAPPGPEELLEHSPTLVRLCESYHRTHSTMVARSRRQRIGLGLLVGGTGVAAVAVSRSGVIAASVVSNVVLTMAAASIVALAVLGLLWMRDSSRLRGMQGTRLLRALQTSCDLPSESLEAFHRSTEPIGAFFTCYDLWRSRYGPTRRGLGGVLAGIRGRAAAA